MHDNSHKMRGEPLHDERRTVRIVGGDESVKMIYYILFLYVFLLDVVFECCFNSRVA